MIFHLRRFKFYAVIICIVIICHQAIVINGIYSENFYEQLIFRSLPNGQILAHFQFKTFIDSNLSHPFGVNSGKHNDIFPLSFLRLFHQLEIQELHFTLTKGFWKYDRWGMPARDTPPNAYLWAWFSTHLNSKSNWKKLISVLSGQLCASINLINPTVTIRPKISYRPFLKLKSIEDPNGHHDYGYLASLPHEAICTENLTPFSKILPCQRNKGLGTLLHATHVFDSRFFSMSLDFEFSCSDITNCDSTTGIELKQNIMIVFDAPLALDGKYSWTLNSLFGNSLENHCPLSSSSRVYVEITPLKRMNDSKSNLFVAPTNYIGIDFDQSGKFIMSQLNDSIDEQQPHRIYAEYDLRTMFKQLSSNSSIKRRINIGIHYSNSYKGKLPYKVDYGQIQVRRYSRGVGVSTGGITVLLTNMLPFDVEAIYLDTIPWYLRMYLHTMRIEFRSLSDVSSEKESPLQRIHPTTLFYEPAQDRIRPHQLEVKVRLRSKSLTEIRFEFDNQFLGWTEFPPDPSRGLYINPATVTLLFDASSKSFLGETYERFLPQIFETLSNSSFSSSNSRLDLYQKSYPLRLYTEPLVILMPTPDFSMPYNVICLVSTALSIAFGPIYNLTTRKIKLINESSEKPTIRRFFFF